MPRGDGTGPNGLGPMTGRATGYCNGYGNPGFMNPIFGGGFGRGGGRGFHRGFRGAGFAGWAGFPGFTAVIPPMPTNQAYYAANGPDPAMEASMLANQIGMMEQSLKNAKDRLNELQKSEE